MTEQSERQATSYTAFVYADDGKLPVRVEHGQFRMTRVKGKLRRQLYVTVQANRLGVPKGRTTWVDESMIHLPVKTRTKGAAQRRRDSKRRAAVLAAQNAGPLIQGSDRTERAEERLLRTEDTEDGSQESTTAVTSVANALKCPQCDIEVMAPIGQDVAYCAECKSE
jgi:hypothetical protein